MSDLDRREATVTDAELKRDVEAWVDATWDPTMTLRLWWSELASAGYAMADLSPSTGGLGLEPAQVNIVRQVLADRGCMGPPGGIGTMLAAPTIAVHGTPEQVDAYVRPILDGTSAWCQLFSEPNAGSDLANIQTRAVRDGDDWIVTGQKVWTSGGHLADLGMLLARTDPDAPSHRGISWFAFPLHQDGVEIRPLREMTGDAVFNEVFIDEARVSNDALIGPLHGGWKVAGTTLGVERTSLGAAKVDLPAESPGEIAGRLGLPVGDLLAAGGSGEDFLAGTHLGQDDLDLWIGMARQHGRSDDPLVRQQLAHLAALVSINWWTAQRSAGGGVPGDANLAKLSMSRLFRHFREAGCSIVGAEAQLAGPGREHGWTVSDLALFSPAPSIYGGTDQIQRNIIGERALGLPREPR